MKGGGDVVGVKGQVLAPSQEMRGKECSGAVATLSRGVEVG